MKHKPIQFIVLAILQALTPFSNVALACWNYHQSPLWVIQHMLASGTWSSLFFFALGPLTGVAILTVRGWSYAIICASALWCMVANLLAWHAHPEMVSVRLLLSVEALPVLLLGYFLAPTTRALFFHPSIRWWEVKPRYEFLCGTVCHRGAEELIAITRNISQGGVFLQTESELVRGETLMLELVHDGEQIRVPTRIVYRMTEQNGYGAQFVHTPTSRRQVRRLTQALERARVSRIPARRNLVRETSDLAVKLTQGKFLFPRLSPHAEKKIRSQH